MSSDSLARKRRSEFESSDDSADDLPPAKIRKSENTSRFSKVLKEKFKNLFNWLTPTFVKNYMIEFLGGSYTQPSPSTSNMGMEDGMKNNSLEEDDDEISIIGVQNGTSSSHLRPINERKHYSFNRGSRQASGNSCPLSSTPFSYPDSRTSKYRQMNGFANREPPYSKNEIAPITNPNSDIDILLDKSKNGDHVKKTKQVKDFYNGSKRDQHAEDLLLETAHRPLRQSKSYTALEVFRLREKEEYRLLLNKVVKQTLYLPAIPKISAIEVDLTEDETQPLSPNYHFKQEKLEHVSNFLSKYCKPSALVPCTAKKTPESQNISISSDSKTDDDVQYISCSDLPKFVPRKKTSSNGSFFSRDWIEELKSTIEIDKRKHLQLISEQNEKLQRYKKRRDAKLAEDQQKLEELRLAGVILPEDVDMDEDVLPEITPEMENIIARALGPGDPNEQLSCFDGTTLTRNDVSTLAKLNWLNDQVINFYMALIVERSKLDNYPSVHAFNSFFYTSVKGRGPSNVLRWTRRIDIFSYDIILVPLHLGLHWALIIVDNRSKQIKYYDSMGSSERECLRIIQNYLIVEMQDKKKISMDPCTYSLEIPKDIPKQMNGSDCGMFTLKYAEYISRDAPITFTQENMPYFRRRMVYELLSKQIL